MDSYPLTPDCGLDGHIGSRDRERRPGRLTPSENTGENLAAHRVSSADLDMATNGVTRGILESFAARTASLLTWRAVVA
jgi:hypothetical protein